MVMNIWNVINDQSHIFVRSKNYKFFLAVLKLTLISNWVKMTLEGDTFSRDDEESDITDYISENEDNLEFTIPVKNRFLMDSGCGTEQWRRKRQRVSTSSW